MIHQYPMLMFLSQHLDKPTQMQHVHVIVIFQKTLNIFILYNKSTFRDIKKKKDSATFKASFHAM